MVLCYWRWSASYRMFYADLVLIAFTKLPELRIEIIEEVKRRLAEVPNRKSAASRRSTDAFEAGYMGNAKLEDTSRRCPPCKKWQNDSLAGGAEPIVPEKFYDVLVRMWNGGDVRQDRNK